MTTIDAVSYDVYACDYEHVCEELSVMVGREVGVCVEHPFGWPNILNTFGILRTPERHVYGDMVRLRFPVGKAGSSFEISRPTTKKAR